MKRTKRKGLDTINQIIVDEVAENFEEPEMKVGEGKGFDFGLFVMKGRLDGIGS